MQIEAMSYHFTPVVITSVGKDVEKRDPLYIIYGNINWCSHYEKQQRVPQKIKNRTTI